MIYDDLVEIAQNEIDKIMLSKNLSPECQSDLMHKLSEQIEKAYKESVVRLMFTGLNG